MHIGRELKIRKMAGRKALTNRENESTEDISSGLFIISGRVTVLIGCGFIGSLLQQVKACLHSSVPCVMKGRGQEVGRIEEFLWTHLDSHAPGSLYISGPPGTGKTATVTKLIQDNPKVCVCAAGTVMWRQKGLYAKSLYPIVLI